MKNAGIFAREIDAQLKGKARSIVLIIEGHYLDELDIDIGTIIKRTQVPDLLRRAAFTFAANMDNFVDADEGKPMPPLPNN